MAEALRATGVQVRHGDRVVLDVPSLEVAAGDTLAVMGPNGAGKSTLLEVLGLVRAPDAGTIAVSGTVARGARERRRQRRAIVTQLQRSIVLEGSVAWNLTLPLRLRGVVAHEARARARRWAEVFGIGHLLERRARTLSGGETRRACLARAFACEPALLLIDEPLSGVDPAFRAEVLDVLARALAERRWTTVFATHHLTEATALATRMLVLVGGRIRQLGPTRDVVAAPADADVASLLRP